MQQKQSLQDQFVSYEIAKELKELEFDEPCLGYYSIIYNSVDQSYSGQLVLGEDPEYLTCQKKMHFILGQNILLAPLYQQCIDWFREKHGINIYVSNSHCYPKFSFDIEYSGEMGPVDLWYCSNEAINNFYEAKERAILKAIELIKKSE